jgi:S-(hydroxymethyl)glutathione synthase
MSETVNIHPSVDHGVKPGSESFTGGTLSCKCTDRTVKVHVGVNVAHNHICGCTKCWKPEGANFSMVAVAPSDQVSVTANGDKLKVVDPSALIQRYACTVCGVHMHGPVEREHAFKGLSFVHPERFEQSGAAAPTFAAFVSSVIESGVPPAHMDAVRSRLRELTLEPYDCLSPALMDYVATWVARSTGKLAA